MKPQRFEGEELDAASLDYLRTVRENHGHGVPGIYLDSSVADLTAASMPGCGAVAGAVLLVVALILMWGLSLSDPLNVAMLVTAVGFLGAWLVVAWVRCLIARGRSDYVGHFKYFDSLQMWHGTGGGVFVLPLRGLQEAKCNHEYSNEGGYSSSNVHIVFEDGAFDVKVKSEPLAEALEVYLNEVARDRGGLPLDRGYDAAARALSEDEDYDPNAEHLVEGIPEPHKARTSLGWLIRYPLVIVLFALTFLGVYQLCKMWRDEAFFAAVTQKNPPDLAELRAYIADPRNTRHRDSVTQRLKQSHEQVAVALEALPGEEDLKKGLAAIIRHLADSPTPVVTFTFLRSPERKENTMDGILGPGETSTMIATQLKAIIDSFIQKMKATPGIANLADQIAGYIGIEDGPAMVSIDPRLDRDDKAGKYALVWTVTLKAGHGDEARENAKVVRWKKVLEAKDPPELERQYRAACEEFAKQFAAALNAPIPAHEKP